VHHEQDGDPAPAPSHQLSAQKSLSSQPGTLTNQQTDLPRKQYVEQISLNKKDSLRDSPRSSGNPLLIMILGSVGKATKAEEKPNPKIIGTPKKPGTLKPTQLFIQN
jgi:hypothetical protein